MTKAQKTLLREIDKWGGDLSPDAEDIVGCRGAAFANVLTALVNSGYITHGENGDYPLTESGLTTARLL